MTPQPPAGPGASTEASAIPPKQSRKWLTLSAMVFLVSMVFIDMTIVTIAAPTIQSSLGMSATGLQWVMSGYLLAMAAFFAFGGRLGDIFGHVKLAVIGAIVFAGASALIGITPDSSIGEAWIISFRLIQGVGAALMFPAALTIVLNSFPMHQRGQATAIFFGIAGGMTAVGPILGGFLTSWHWQAIFWINIPIAVIGLLVLFWAKPVDECKREPIDWFGLVLIVSGMGLTILGFQESSTWGWDSPATIGCIVAGIALLGVFASVELRVKYPTIDVRIFMNRAFTADNIALFFISGVFISIFLFSQLYAQIALDLSTSESGFYIMYFFIGFVIAAQIGGRLLDKIGGYLPTVVGMALAGIGLFLWAHEMPNLSMGATLPGVIIAGAGFGLSLGQSNTDAMNRAARAHRGEAGGVTQTVRNFGSAVVLAIVGTLLITFNATDIASALQSAGVPAEQAAKITEDITASISGGGGSGDGQQTSGNAAEDKKIQEALQTGYAKSSEKIFGIMAGIMGVGALIAAFTVDRRKPVASTDDELP